MEDNEVLGRISFLSFFSLWFGVRPSLGYSPSPHHFLKKPHDGIWSFRER